MKAYSRVPQSKNPHHAEASQLNFIESQMSRLYMTQDNTEWSLRTDLAITRTVKNC